MFYEASILVRIELMTKPKLILMSGLPCTGKSTFAEAIAKEMHLPIFSVDPIESAIIKSGIEKSFETGYACVSCDGKSCA